VDLAEWLIRVIEEHRDEINASQIAEGQSGRIELQVNPKVRRIDVSVLLRDKAA